MILGAFLFALLQVSGGQLSYEQCGTGTAVILLHDGLLDSAVWDDAWPSLCASYHVVRYDRRGYGASTPARAPFKSEDDLLQVLRECKVSRAVLVGSSSGSALALDFAIADPEMTEALFLIGPVVHGMRSSDYFFQRGAEAPADPKAAAEFWSKDRFQVSGDRPEARKKILDILLANPQNLSVPGQFEIRPSPPSVTRLAQIQAPTLMIVGDGDIADVHAFSGAVQAAVPVVRREVWKDDGHLIQLEKPAEVVSRLKQFIDVVERKTVTLADSVLRRYEGSYTVGNSPARVLLKKHQLMLEIRGDAYVPLFATSQSEFLVRTTGTQIQFRPDAMVIRNPSGETVCPRMKKSA